MAACWPFKNMVCVVAVVLNFATTTKQMLHTYTIRYEKTQNDDATVAARSICMASAVSLRSPFTVRLRIRKCPTRRRTHRSDSLMSCLTNSGMSFISSSMVENSERQPLWALSAQKTMYTNTQEQERRTVRKRTVANLISWGACNGPNSAGR